MGKVKYLAQGHKAISDRLKPGLADSRGPVHSTSCQSLWQAHEIYLQLAEETNQDNKPLD